MATLYKADGTVETVHATKTDEETGQVMFTLAELQAFVGGTDLESVPCHGGRTMFINGDGMGLGLPRNAKATAIVADWPMPGDYIKGDAIVLEADEPA